MRRVWMTMPLLLAACGHEPAPPPPAPAPPQAQPKSLDEACARWKCRDTTHVHLDTPDGPFDTEIGRSPYCDGVVARILPGEHLTLTGDVQGDQLMNLRVVDAEETAPDVLAMSFKQKSIGGQPSMMFSIHSTFKRVLKYHAGMQLPGKNGFRATSTCTIGPNMSAFETWPGGIVSLLLREFHFVAPGDLGQCAN
jgi:hypothetical protein